MSPAPDGEELAQQKFETARGFSDFNDATWIGKRVTSFSITSDVAAGVVKRKDARGDSIYKSSVRTTLDIDGINVRETLSWNDQNDSDDESSSSSDSNVCVSSRTTKLGESSIDVDSVDGSYSLDASLMGVPSMISGTDAMIKFGIEHSLAISDHERVRCFLLYDVDDILARVVVCDEERCEEEQKELAAGPSTKIGDFDDLSSTEDEFKAATADVNDLVNKILGLDATTIPEDYKVKQRISESSSVEDRMDQLSKAMGKQQSSKEDDNGVIIKRNPMSMFGLVTGVWLGDCVVRNHANKSKKGFGGQSGGGNKKAFKKNQKPKPGAGISDGFAEWSTGVQKVALSFLWDYEEKVRQRLDAGRSMGVSISSEMPSSSMGTLIVNDMARGKNAEDRLLYIDFDMGAYAAFMLGSAYIKAPRSLSFSYSSGKVQPFFTEFGVFQNRIIEEEKEDSKDDNDEMPPQNMPELFYSRLTRLYDSDGRLSQGTTSFFNLDNTK
eukprot:CAMPEP_0195525198 /NCGR_PEP_ID=MMETSP0794_2-20130614/25503_1 /TAXON_ID=515487 /ORGANISM="Stephanopyxis turris, Strain CCMP 815" /LENGTH=496 /DNA_ID=CAMNT_0040655597 /DNA_START=376 /DNA_END=1866 /DNA_ORIENTATION=+